MTVYFPDVQGLYELCRDFAGECKTYLSEIEQGFEMESKDPADPYSEQSKDAVFTGRVYVYYEGSFSIQQLAELEQIYAKEGLFPQFRGREYATTRYLQSKDKPKQH